MRRAGGWVSEPRYYSWADYLYPGSTVLRNRFGATDALRLYVLGYRATTIRELELALEPGLVARTFDVEHVKAIHRYLFQDVFEWAGRFRTVDLGTDRGTGISVTFTPRVDLEEEADEIFTDLRAVAVFRRRPRDALVAGLAVVLVRINGLHPFRDGNARTLRLVARHIAEEAGYVLDWHRIGPAEQNQIFALAHISGEIRPLEIAIDRALRRPAPDEDRSEGTLRQFHD